MGPKKTNTQIRMACECGSELVFESDEDRIDCECGAVYAVTVSLLKQPLDVEH